MLAFAAISTVVVTVIDVSERGSLELGVFHGRTIAPGACGLLLYNSYSVRLTAILYELIQVPAKDSTEAVILEHCSRMKSPAGCRANIGLGGSEGCEPLRR